MVLLILGLIGVVVAGWALGRMRPEVNLATFVFALFGSITAHSALQWAFLEGRLDAVVGDPRTEVPAAAVILIAAGEAAGLWVPLLLIPWMRLAARWWVVFYVLAAVTLAAVYFYFPFDLMFIAADLLTADGPPYLFFALGCLPLAALPFIAGFVQSRRQLEDRMLDDKEL
jgi:hypothetical protein